jgi:outer membrane receptor protein involved in Fe transport
VQHVYQLTNNTTFVTGSHSLKFGVDFRNNISPQVFSQRIRGDYGYATLERYLLNLSPNVIAERNLGQAKYYGNKHDFYWFVQDEYRVRRNITLNLGLRHEYKGIPLSDGNHRLNSGSSVPGLIEFREPKASWKDFAPRIGVTYSPGSSGDTVIRAGFGMAYDVYFTNLGLNNKPPQMEATITRDPEETTTGFLAKGGIRPDEKPAWFPTSDGASSRPRRASARRFSKHWSAIPTASG